MKAVILSLLILGFSGISNSMAQHQRDSIGPAIFGLLKQKHNYDDLMSRKRITSPEKHRILAASELQKSEYGRATRKIKENATQYLAYIEKNINTNAAVLSQNNIDYEKIPLVDSGAPDRNVISKLDFLKAVKYSLFEQKSDALLPLYQIPGIRLKYGGSK